MNTETLNQIQPRRLPKIGSRVAYRRVTPSGEVRTCTGTVTAHYLGGERLWDEEAQAHYVSADHVAVKVEWPLPAWWPYGTSDLFAPDADEVKPI